eukprot:NODE_267_length_11298_cov_1.167872.p9 type:complete len:119 gc:universal NODE_267_length_11298_cov_1.167872:6545-6901(+)
MDLEIKNEIGNVLSESFVDIENKPESEKEFNVEAIERELSNQLNWDKICTEDGKRRVARYLDKWRDGEQYHALFIVCILNRDLTDVIRFFHENGRETNPELMSVYEGLLEFLKQLSLK